MAKVLGRVTGAIDLPRGPDALYRVHVPAEWLDEGATIELALPRNLTCALCEGGGCDACDRSGAVTLRDRKAPGESVRVTLPDRGEPGAPPSSGKRGLVLRIPERGGPAFGSSALPRGNLLLVVLKADEPGPGIVRVEPALPVHAEPPSIRPVAARARPPLPRSVLIGVIALIALILFLVWLRLTGRG